MKELQQKQETIQCQENEIKAKDDAMKCTLEAYMSQILVLKQEIRVKENVIETKLEPMKKRLGLKSK